MSIRDIYYKSYWSIVFFPLAILPGFGIRVALAT